MITQAKPTKRLPLYYSSIAATLLEYAAATYFMMTLAQSTVTKVICLLIAVVVSTWTISMWTTISDLIKKGHVILAMVVSIALNVPAFIYDVHGILGVTSEVNSEFENSTDIAKQEKQFLNAQFENSKGFSAIALKPNEVLTKISLLTLKNNHLITEQSKCKNRWGNCAKDIGKQIKNNDAEIAVLNNSLLLANSTISAATESSKSIQSTLSGSNDNQKAHEVFKTISNWFYDDVSHAKQLQGKILGYSAVFLAALVMVLPFLANLLCFDVGSEVESVKSPAPAFKPVQKHHEPIFNRMFVKPTVTAKKQTEIKAGHIEDLAEAVNRENETRLGFIGFCDPENMPMPEAAIPVPKAVIPEGEEKDIVSHSIGTGERTQSGTGHAKRISSKGRGKSAGLEFKAIEDAVISGDFFKFKDTVSIRNVVDYSKYISPNDSGIGKDTASVYVTMLKENNRPLNKGQWEIFKGHS